MVVKDDKIALLEKVYFVRSKVSCLECSREVLLEVVSILNVFP